MPRKLRLADAVYHLTAAVRCTSSCLTLDDPHGRYRRMCRPKFDGASAAHHAHRPAAVNRATPSPSSHMHHALMHDHHPPHARDMRLHPRGQRLWRPGISARSLRTESVSAVHAASACILPPRMSAPIASIVREARTACAGIQMVPHEGDHPPPPHCHAGLTVMHAARSVRTWAVSGFVPHATRVAMAATKTVSVVRVLRFPVFLESPALCRWPRAPQLQQPPPLWAPAALLAAFGAPAARGS